LRGGRHRGLGIGLLVGDRELDLDLVCQPVRRQRLLRLLHGELPRLRAGWPERGQVARQRNHLTDGERVRRLLRGGAVAAATGSNANREDRKPGQRDGQPQQLGRMHGLLLW